MFKMLQKYRCGSKIYRNKIIYFRLKVRNNIINFQILLFSIKNLAQNIKIIKIFYQHFYKIRDKKIFECLT